MYVLNMNVSSLRQLQLPKNKIDPLLYRAAANNNHRGHAHKPAIIF